MSWTRICRYFAKAKLSSLRQWGMYLLSAVLILMVLYVSVQHNGYIQVYIHTSQNVTEDVKIRIEPVNVNDWKARFPKYKDVPENITQTDWWKAAAFIQWDLQKRPFEYRCKRIKLVGNWWLCMDRKYKIKPPCLVYSFGIAFDFRFDDAMAKFGCEVHSFDPSMKMKEHTRNTLVHFHPIGLSHVNRKQFSPRADMYVTYNSTWNVMTLHSIMKHLGHTGRQLDVLKIDVEGYEWDVIDYLLHNNFFANLNQFMLEYHLFPTWPSRAEYPKLLKLYKTLHDIGLVKFVTALHPLNHKPEKFNIQADVAYVNEIFVPRKR